MRLLADELAFLDRVATGQEPRSPENLYNRLIVQILIGYRLIRSIGGHLQMTDEGRRVVTARRSRERMSGT